MELEDLKPYFELYKRLKESGKDTVLNFELGKKEKEFAGKEINLSGIVSEINLEKHELIATTQTVPRDNSLINLTSNHFFIFASAHNIRQLLEAVNAEVDDLVQMKGTISTLHRNSVVRINLVSLAVLKKKYRESKAVKKKGCFIATAVYGNTDTPEVQQFYLIRDHVLAKSFGGRIFIKCYYLISPTLAGWVKNKPRIKYFIKRYILDKILKYYSLEIF